MATARRVDSETDKTRLLLDVTERLMLADGYAAVSSRSVAAKAEVAPALIHYYFPTLDDLFLAVFRRRTRANQEQLVADLATTDQPLWTIWEYSVDKTGVGLTQEFMALANHRKAIRAEIVDTAERLRQIELAAVAGVLRDYDVDTTLLSPAALMVFMAAVPRVIVIEETLGMSTGHADAVGVVTHFLTQLEGRRTKTSGQGNKKKRGS